MDQKSEEISGAFAEDLETIAEQIKTEREHGHTQESAENTPAEKERSLDLIRKSLHELYLADGESDTKEPHQNAMQGDTTSENVGHLDGVDEESREKISDLVQGALTDGILSAVKMAQKEKDPYIMDAFHDSLTHLIHHKMSEQGLI